MSAVPFTVSGHKRLTAELKRLKSVERPSIINAIAEARAHGDLKENAEYHAAKERQGFIEARIRDLEAKLSHCQVINVEDIPNEGKVIFGATITVLDVEKNDKFTYQIVGEDEADVKINKISYTSPLARALIGKFVDDEINVNTPQGKKRYEVVDVKYI